VGLALLKAEMGKVWSSPILEITIALMAVMSVTAVTSLNDLVIHSEFPEIFQSMVAGSVSATVGLLILPLVVMCAVLMSLSFARDYEQGLIQSTLSLPVSRKLFFVVKFFAVVLPLVLVSWFLTVFFVGASFYPDMFLVFKFSFYVLPVVFLSLMFCGGLGVLIALVIKRTIPSVLTALLANIFFWFPTTISTEYALREGASYANYLCLIPYKTGLVFLDKLLGIVPRGITPEIKNALEYTLSGSSFAVLLIFYACILVIPMFVYFYRRFEVCD
jgi:ABC-type transport system involved in multi-copper enzyme maturation permease subunit